MSLFQYALFILLCILRAWRKYSLCQHGRSNASSGTEPDTQSSPSGSGFLLRNSRYDETFWRGHAGGKYGNTVLHVGLRTLKELDLYSAKLWYHTKNAIQSWNLLGTVFLALFNSQNCLQEQNRNKLV